MSSTDQCRARTADGERCKHAADEDGYCHQHDSDDPTAQSVDDSRDDEGGSDTDDEADDESTAAAGDADGDGTPATASLVEVRDAAREIAGDLVEREVDGVVEVRNHGGSWTAVVEVVERHAIPDTQDILGRYEFDLTEDATATDYRRIDRYRRGECDREEF